MENFNNDNQQPAEQTGGPLEGMSPQNVNLPDNNTEEDSVVYSQLGLYGQPDSYNTPDDEPADSILHTDTMTARHAMDEMSNDIDIDALEKEFLSDEELDEISDDRLEAAEGDVDNYANNNEP